MEGWVDLTQSSRAFSSLAWGTLRPCYCPQHSLRPPSKLEAGMRDLGRHPGPAWLFVSNDSLSGLSFPICIKAQLD